MSTANNIKKTETSLGFNVNKKALCSASKMNQKKNKIPRGVTGAMPGKPSRNAATKRQIIGFNTKEKNIENGDVELEQKEYDLEVSEPPEYQLKELELMDDSKMHPRMRRDAPTTDINIEHLTPEMDKQRRRESVIIDEDGEEFKNIQKEREHRIAIQELRNQTSASYKASYCSGIYGSYVLKAMNAETNQLPLPLDMHMPIQYAPSLSTGVYGAYLNNKK